VESLITEILVAEIEAVGIGRLNSPQGEIDPAVARGAADLVAA